MVSRSLAAEPQAYQLSDDLARLCLPQEFKDSCRNLAYANSICALFLVVGLIGLKAPRVHIREINPPRDVVPVVFQPPEEKPAEVQPRPDEPEPEVNPNADEVPTIAMVVAVENSPAVRFAVPVQGAVAIAKEARLATPPPPVQQAPARPVQFNQNVSDGGTYPSPLYPGIAVRNRYQGTVVIDIRVNELGLITSVTVFKSSGFGVLDEAAVNVVKTRWRFPPGKEGWYHWACTFQLQ